MVEVAKMKFQYYLQEPAFLIGDIDEQTVSRPKNYTYTFKNGRKKHGFIYIVSGKMSDSFNNCCVKELIAEKGELLFIPSGSAYTGTYLEDNTKIKIIQFNIISGALPDYLTKPTKINLINAGELVESCFMPLENHKSYHPFYHLSSLYKLLWMIDENYNKIPGKYKKLKAALTELAEYYYENKKISYYADLCNMSEVNFRRLFHEYTGMSPIDYRNDIRLISAKNKLQSGEYNVSETAFECGFTNLSFFIRKYKEKYGYTPKKE